MWSQAVKLSEDHDFETIILDTEGLNSVRKYINLSIVKENRKRCCFGFKIIHTFTITQLYFYL